MRVSGEEVFRVSQLDSDGGPSGTAAVLSPMGMFAVSPLQSLEPGGVYTANSLDVHRVLENAEEISDIREDVVASLRARIESGAYAVTGEQVAEMLVRRFHADRVR